MNWIKKLLITGLCMGSPLFLSFNVYASNGFTLPSDLKVIEAYAFEGASIQDTDLELPEGLLRIETRAFAGNQLGMVWFPRSVQVIASDAFDDCTGFQPVVYPGSYAEKWCEQENITHYVIQDLGVERHTQQEILAFMEAHPSSIYYDDEFRQTPTGGDFGGDTYNYGLLTTDTLDNAINMVNQVRYIAGINANVVNDPEHEASAGAAALVNALNDNLSHSPERPDVLSDSRYDELYQLACSGAGSSNLHYATGIYGSLGYSVLSYMDDSDPSNIDRVGHRRWILNPSMGRTTFGLCTARQTIEYDSEYTYTYQVAISAMYSFDRSGSGRQTKIAWPAQQTPLSRFIGGADQAWSVSFGEELDINSIQVELVRGRDGKSWNFTSSAADGDFYIDNGWYGLPGCVIFCPAGLETLQAGDQFRVQIINKNNFTILQYDVEFF